MFLESKMPHFLLGREPEGGRVAGLGVGWGWRKPGHLLHPPLCPFSSASLFTESTCLTEPPAPVGLAPARPPARPPGVDRLSRPSPKGPLARLGAAVPPSPLSLNLFFPKDRGLLVCSLSRSSLGGTGRMEGCVFLPLPCPSLPSTLALSQHGRVGVGCGRGRARTEFSVGRNWEKEGLWLLEPSATFFQRGPQGGHLGSRKTCANEWTAMRE